MSKLKIVAGTLYVQVIVAVAIGIAVGIYFPETAIRLKPLGDGFIKLIKMMIAPILFCTIVTGIAGMGDLKKLGRVGIKTLLYFEVVTTFSLMIGLVVINVLKPGEGMNVNATTLDVSAISAYSTEAKARTISEFLLNIIPSNIADAFAKGEILQILLISVLFGYAATHLRNSDRGGRALLDWIEQLSQVFFKMVNAIMRVAPIGAFGAMAFTVGSQGAGSLAPLAKLMGSFYLTCVIFILGVLGAIARVNGLNILKFIRYIADEIFLVLGTSSSESALPRMLSKMEAMGCGKSVVGLVIPAGYSFNLDGTSIYLTMAAIFIAQATGTHLDIVQQLTILGVLLISSKGAAGVTGSGFITLAATLSAVPTIPVAGLVLILGIDRFMSEARAITNLIGNGVATVVIARWEKEFDPKKAEAALNP